MKGEELYEKALRFATTAHEGTFRKGTEIPYIVHPVEAAEIVRELISEYHELTEDDYKIISAALLHDVVEDTPYTAEDIRDNFGDEVAEMVAHETENKRPEIPPEQSWKIRKQEFLDSLKTAPIEAKIISFGDKLSNMRSLAEDYRNMGDKLWQKFHQKDKNEQAWYYRSLADEFVCFSESPLYKEYIRLMNEVFVG